MPKNIKKINAQLEKIEQVLSKYEKVFARAGGATEQEEKIMTNLHEKIHQAKGYVAKIAPELAGLDGATSPEVDKATERDIDYEYTEIVADLFRKGRGDSHKIDPNDVRQGYLADCYFLAAIQAVAQSDPQALENLIKDNNDGTYEVTLYVHKGLISFSRTPVKITVDTTVPTRKGTTNPVYAGKGDNELWVLLLEKAYAQYEGDYGDIAWGQPSEAMGLLLSEDGDDINIKSLSDAETAEERVEHLLGGEA